MKKAAAEMDSSSRAQSNLLPTPPHSSTTSPSPVSIIAPRRDSSRTTSPSNSGSKQPNSPAPNNPGPMAWVSSMHPLPARRVSEFPSATEKSYSASATPTAQKTTSAQNPSRTTNGITSPPAESRTLAKSLSSSMVFQSLTISPPPIQSMLPASSPSAA